MTLFRGPRGSFRGVEQGDPVDQGERPGTFYMAIQSNDSTPRGTGCIRETQVECKLSEGETECQAKGLNRPRHGRQGHLRYSRPFRLFWLRIRFTQDRQP